MFGSNEGENFNIEDEFEYMTEERNRVRIETMQDQMKTVKFDAQKVLDEEF